MQTTRFRLAAAVLTGLTLVAIIGMMPTARAGQRRTPSPPAAKVDFSRDIRPILSTKCFACHGADPETRLAGLRLDRRQDAVAPRGATRPVTPGDAAHSEVYRRIAARDPARRMPPPGSGRILAAHDVDLLKRWIDQGAPYAEHWAFRKPERPPVPTVPERWWGVGAEDRKRGRADERKGRSGSSTLPLLHSSALPSSPRSWARNPIDAFILSRLRKEELRPSPEADRYTLIRRVTLDLTGLPPTPAEVEAFVNDRSPDAYEKVVDRLLASPHYGERWAKMWLDLARYADSAGYGSDPLRLNIWPYREWVIDAFNRDLPYDRFTVEQIAGDLLPTPTPIATAFHRNTMTNTEGGTDDEEFRVAAVKDRIATTAQVWMGLTLGCAQCHSHKYDPITQREYYQFFALFNQTEDNDQPDERPTMPVLTPPQREQSDRLKREIAAVEQRLTAPTAALQSELAAWERAQAHPIEWTTLDPVELRSADGATLAKLPDGSVLASGTSAATDTYTVRLHSPIRGITALRVEALPHDTLPKNGPGRDPSAGNLVLTTLRLAVLPEHPKIPVARFLRVESPGPARLLSLAEVQVFSGGANVASRGQATQSSTDYDAPARLAIDGITNGDFFAAHSVTHTRTEDNPWWEVDLGSELPIDAVAVWNRTDGGLGTRLSNFRVSALSADRKPVWEKSVADPPAPSLRLETTGEAVVTLRGATATYSQPGFEPERAIDADEKTGWAIGGQTGQPQAIVVETGAPVGTEGAVTLVLTLAQNHGAQHTLGHFRILATSANQPVRELPNRVRAILTTPPAQRSEAQRGELAAYFRPLAPSLAPLYQELARKQKELAAIKPVDLPVMRELPSDKRRVTHLMVKGNFLNPGEVVEPGLPAAFPALPAGAPKNRLDVAEWLVSPENPLTARVAVNRFWAQLFGTGIVETEEDFGTQGAPPSHPELLDWLAVSFRDGVTEYWSDGVLGAEKNKTPPLHHSNTPCPNPKSAPWDVKALLRLIVTSATYRQESRANPAAMAKDPRNRLLAYYPRRRLDAEAVRDQALALSGLLAPKIGGPSVYPPQPDGLWRAAFNGERTWPTSTGEDRYRRGLYTFWRRTVPYPSMSTFDAPSREICTLRRVPTNTPLQALVALNDPAYVEMAQALARRIAREGGATPEDRARFALRLALARPASDEQVAALVALYEKELARYQADPTAATKLATEPLGALPSGMDVAELAAWTVVANVVLNMDGVLEKG